MSLVRQQQGMHGTAQSPAAQMPECVHKARRVMHTRQQLSAHSVSSLHLHGLPTASPLWPALLLAVAFAPLPNRMNAAWTTLQRCKNPSTLEGWSGA